MEDLGKRVRGFVGTVCPRDDAGETRYGAYMTPTTPNQTAC